MGFDSDCVLNIQTLTGEYFCAVCRTLVYPNEAIQAPCTHLYCKHCLTYVASTTHACPYDGYRVTEADSKPLLESNKTLADTIGKIQVHCLYYRSGCTWQGSLSDCTNHVSKCAFGESAVICSRCGIQLKHRQAQEHAENGCGVQSKGQQPGGVQGSTSTATGSGAGAAATAAPDQIQTAGLAGGSASQAMSQSSMALVYSQVANQPANSAAQPQAAQAAMPTADQMYSQQLYYQQLYQQYYQLYPGYDPYQQNYQYYYQYPQVAQQYLQQPTQAYQQAYLQLQPQGYVQAHALRGQAQPMVQSQQQVQPQAQLQSAQPPLQPQAQTAVNAQALVPSAGQAQPQIRAEGQAQPLVLEYGQAQSQIQLHGQAPMAHAISYIQAQSYTQPLPVPQQQLQVPQYPHPQMPHPHAQPYLQSETQHYSHLLPQVNSHPHSPPNLQPLAHPPQQPLPHSAHFQTPNAVSGQSGAALTTQYVGAQHVAHHPNQIQGPSSFHAAPICPTQSSSNMQNQQEPTMLSAQGQPSSGSSAKHLPVYPHAQQPGHPFEQRPTVQAAHQVAPQQYGQQHFPAQGPFTQHRPSMTGQSRAQGPSQMPPLSQQSHGQSPSRPMGAQAVAYPLTYATGHAGANQVRLPQSNQNHPVKANNQASKQHVTQSRQVSSGEKSSDPMMRKSVHNQLNTSNEAGDMSKLFSDQSREGKKKLKAKNSLTASADGNKGDNSLGSKELPDAKTKLDYQVQEVEPRIKGDTGEEVLKTPSDANKSGAENHVDGIKKAEGQDTETAKHVAGSSAAPSGLRNSPSESQVHGANSYPSVDHDRNQLQPMPYGQNEHGALAMPQIMKHSVSSQQPALLGHPSDRLRPQGPGQDPASGIPLENPCGGILGRGSSGSLGRPTNVNHQQGNRPPHQAGQPQNPSSNQLVGPSVSDHRPRASRYEKIEAQSSGHKAMKFGGSSALDSMPPPRMCDDKVVPFAEEQLKRFPAVKMEAIGSDTSRLLLPFHPKDVGERARAFPNDDARRADLNQLSGPLVGPGVGRQHIDSLPPRSPGRDYHGFPSRTLRPNGDVGGNESRSFEGSKPYNFLAEPLGNSTHDNRIPVPPSGNFDALGNLRLGENLTQHQDSMPRHLQRGGDTGLRSSHLGEVTAFGRPGEPSPIAPPFGNFPPHVPFHDSFAGEKLGHPLQGESGFRSGYEFPHAHDGGFHPEMDPFDNPRMQKPESIMCRICNVECRSVEGLDLHSQSREHQRIARDMALSFKHQSKKKQKMLNNEVSVGEGRNGGRPRNSGSQGRGKKH
ncbi:hypothetical protein vseg_004245 [Gypsophila vaccaria]